MSDSFTLNYDISSNYTLSNAVISAGKGKLALVNLPDLLFQEDFNDDTDFNYDVSKVEFVNGKLRQIDQRPANQTFFATWDGENEGGNDSEANWISSGSSGSKILQGSNNVIFDAANSRVEIEGTDSWVQYDASNGNANHPQVGALRADVEYRYSGTPAESQILLSNGKNPGSDRGSLMTIFHSTSGDLTLRVYDNNATLIVNKLLITGFLPTSGQRDVFEVNYDFTNGETRVFRNGNQIGTTYTETLTRSASHLSAIYLGRFPDVTAATQLYVYSLQVFDAVQHTANHSVPSEPASYPFLAATVDNPIFDYSGVGAIQSVDNATFVETGATRYTVAGRYWDGTDWVVSDGSYAQANDSATIIANITEFPATGAEQVPTQTVFPNAQTQSSVDDIQVEFTGEEYASEGSILSNASFTAEELNSFEAAEQIPAGDSLKYAIEINGQLKYWDGSAVVDSDGSSSQASTLSEIQNNIGEFLNGVGSTVKIYVVMTSGNGTTTPEIDTVTVGFDYSAIEPTEPGRANVYLYLTDIEGNPIEGATVTIEPNREPSEYVEAASRVIAGSVEKQTDPQGFVNFKLIHSSQFQTSDGTPLKYRLKITVGNRFPISNLSTGQVIFEVPDVGEVNLTDQISAA